MIKSTFIIGVILLLHGVFISVFDENVIYISNMLVGIAIMIMSYYIKQEKAE